MSIIFNAEDHSYKSLDTSEDIRWISVTSLVSQFKEPFDSEKVAARVSKSKKSKWYGLEPKKILALWKAESERALILLIIRQTKK